MLGRAPRIAVAGLNPHAGEGGLFGREEIEIIAPAIAMACAQGMDVHGPFAPDTVFMRARARAGQSGEFDVVVAMYHDQGLIPVKYLGVDKGVNVTLGLPLVRTSPDHGTAFDIAGTGRADASSLIEAIRMARALVATAAPGCRRGLMRPSGVNWTAVARAKGCRDSPVRDLLLQAVANLAQQQHVFRRGRWRGSRGRCLALEPVHLFDHQEDHEGQNRES